MIVRRFSGSAGLLALLAVTAPGAAAAAPERASYRTQVLPTPKAIAYGASASRAKAATSATAARIDVRTRTRFSLAALRWPDGRQAVSGRMRAQRTDGTWTDWTDLESEEAGLDGAAEGPDPAQAAAARTHGASRVATQGSTEPTWTGPARRLQVELNGPAPAGLRAALVDVTGAVPRPRAKAARASRQTDEYAGINPRATWDPNNECAPRARAEVGSVQAVVVHHTAGSNDYTQAQVPAVMLAICKYHRNSNGWNDIGYNVLVDRFGGAWEGRAGGLTNAVIGAHAQGFNSVSAGISMIGDYTAIAPSPATIATVARVAAWKLAVARVPRTGTVALTSAGGSLSRYRSGEIATLPRVLGHRDVGQTACPGTVGYTILDGVRASVAAATPVIPAVLPAPVAEAPPAPEPPANITIQTKRRLAAGTPAVVTGTAKEGSSLIGGASVALQVGDGLASWQTVGTTQTNAAGKYAFTRKFSRSWKVRVIRTDGSGGASANVELIVVPRVKLTAPARTRVNRKVTLRGSIAPGRGPVMLEIARRSASGRYVAGKPVPATLRGRSISVPVTPHSVALYRFRLVYAGSDLAAPARSPWVYGRVVAASTAGGASLSS